MAPSVSDGARSNAVPGPDRAFTIAPDNDTRLRLAQWHQRYGAIYRVPEPRGGPPQWVVHDPKCVEHVLVRAAGNYSKGAGLERVKILLGNGLMVSEGDFWARQRRLIQPAFRPRALADFNAMIFDENVRLARRCDPIAAADRPIDMAAQVSELTLEIVLKSIFGPDYEALIDGGARMLALLTGESKRDLEFAARFHRLTRVVERIVEARLDTPRAEFDLLGHMLAARGKNGESMPRRALVDEIMTLIVAGHETTASALAWAWYLIATHPDVYRRLQAEVDALDEDTLRETGGAGAGLAYTERVISETLRLYPPGWLLSRRAKGADRLGPYRIEAGTQIFISPYILHRQTGYWREPERFDPSRFEPGGEPAHRFAYAPFAAGPRHCIGEQLALTEMRVHLAYLIRRFVPRYCHDAPPGLESQINLRAAGAIWLQLRRR